MKAKIVIVLVAAAIIGLVLYRFLPRPKDGIVDPVEPHWINPGTGELLTSDKKGMMAKEFNSEALKEQRAASLQAILNPEEHSKKIAPVFPPKPASNVPDFDIAHPERFVRAMRDQETPEQREARELSKIAIENPAAYADELRRRGVVPKLPPSEPRSTLNNGGEKGTR